MFSIGIDLKIRCLSSVLTYLKPLLSREGIIFAAKQLPAETIRSRLRSKGPSKEKSCAASKLLATDLDKKLRDGALLYGCIQLAFSDFFQKVVSHFRAIQGVSVSIINCLCVNALKKFILRLKMLRHWDEASIIFLGDLFHRKLNTRPQFPKYTTRGQLRRFQFDIKIMTMFFKLSLYDRRFANRRRRP